MKIALKKPIDGINEVSLETPTLTHLVGLKLSDIAHGDIPQTMSLLTKLTPLTKEQIASLKPSDFTRLWQAVVSFLVDIDSMD